MAQNIGIATCGASAVGTAPVAALIEEFIAKNLESAADPEQIAKRLLARFGDCEPRPAAEFHVAGYRDREQQVWQVDVAANSVKTLRTGPSGAAWNGEADVLQRLHNRVGLLDDAGKLV